MWQPYTHKLVAGSFQGTLSHNTVVNEACERFQTTKNFYLPAQFTEGDGEHAKTEAVATSQP